MINKLAGTRAGAIVGASGHASRLLGICLVTMGLAACAQSPGGGLRASLGSGHRSSVASISPRHTEVANATESEVGASSVGVASYYWEGTETASGERFNPQELTAAHPNLPFGTHLRVTNLATGQSV